MKSLLPKRKKHEMNAASCRCCLLVPPMRQCTQCVFRIYGEEQYIMSDTHANAVSELIPVMNDIRTCDDCGKTLRVADAQKAPHLLEYGIILYTTDDVSQRPTDTAEFVAECCSALMPLVALNSHSLNVFTAQVESVDLTDKFSCGHKVTASPEWVRRHL